MFWTIVGAILFVEVGIPVILSVFFNEETSGCFWIGLVILLLIFIL